MNWLATVRYMPQFMSLSYLRHGFHETQSENGIENRYWHTNTQSLTQWAI